MGLSDLCSELVTSPLDVYVAARSWNLGVENCLRHRSLLGALVRRAFCVTDRSCIWRLWAFLWCPFGALLGPFGGPFESLWEPFGDLLSRLGALFGPSWGLLKAFGRLGALLAASWGSHGALLGLSWGALGPSGSRLGPSWRPLRPSWTPLKPSWGGGLRLPLPLRA